MKINAQTLSAAGWSDAQIDRYYTLLDRKQARGLAALSPEGRAFLRSARTAVDAYEAARIADLAAASKRRVNGVQPVETKLHYRWTAAEADAVTRYIEMAPYEVSALQIVKTEICLALSKYQPILDQIDTSKRGKFDPAIAELLQEAAVFAGARLAQFDFDGFTGELKTTFEDKWNSAWDAHYEMMAGQNIVFSDTDELEYREVVRATVERLVREVFPSVTAAV